MRITEKEFIMKSQITRIAFCLILAALLLTGSAWAFPSGKLMAQIPFSFYAVDRLMPAGTYLITIVNNGFAVKIQRQDSADFTFVVTMPNSNPRISGDFLTFHRYGADNFLREIQSADLAIGRSLSKAHKEKELAATYAKSDSKDQRLAGPVQVTVPLKGE